MGLQLPLEVEREVGVLREAMQPQMLPLQTQRVRQELMVVAGAVVVGYIADAQADIKFLAKEKMAAAVQFAYFGPALLAHSHLLV